MSSIALITLTFFVTALITPYVFSDRHGDDGDLREEIVWGLGAVAGVAGGVAAGAALVGTAPAWLPVVGAIGAGATILGIGIGLWDILDGPEDNCHNCDGSGCNTCEPPDPDGCPNCDGSGCNTCEPPPPPEPTRKKRQGGRSLTDR